MPVTRPVPLAAGLADGPEAALHEAWCSGSALQLVVATVARSIGPRFVLAIVKATAARVETRSVAVKVAVAPVVWMEILAAIPLRTV